VRQLDVDVVLRVARDEEGNEHASHRHQTAMRISSQTTDFAAIRAINSLGWV